MAEWFEDFFNGLYGKVLPNQFDEAATLKQVRVVKRLLGLRKGRRVLDVPCGMGRLTIPMARMGYMMTGVDICAPYIRKARRQAKKEDLDIRFTHKDMRQINYDSEFDAVFNWFTSLGYFSDTDNLNFCKKVLRALKPGGKFLIETQNKSWLLANFRTHMKKTIGGVRIDNRTRWNEKTGRVISKWTLRRGNIIERRRSSIKIFNGAEIRALLRSAGFRDIELFGSPPPDRLTRHSQRLIAIGKRPTKLGEKNGNSPGR